MAALGFILGYLMGASVSWLLFRKIVNNYKEMDEIKEEILYNALRKLPQTKKIEVLQSVYGKNWIEHVPDIRIHPSAIKALEYGARLIKETEQEIMENTLPHNQ